MPIRPEPKSEFGNLARYVRFVKDNFPIAKVIRPGNFYVCVYRFNRKTEPYSVLKFYDIYPFIFVYELHKNKDKDKMFRGINFHHVPIRSRKLWLGRTKRLIGESFDENKRLIRLAAWQRLFVMMKKLSKASVRQYYLKRVVQPRLVPNDRVDELLNYYAKTYYGVSINQIEAQYLLFRL